MKKGTETVSIPALRCVCELPVLPVQHSLVTSRPGSSSWESVQLPGRSTWDLWVELPTAATSPLNSPYVLIGTDLCVCKLNFLIQSTWKGISRCEGTLTSQGWGSHSFSVPGLHGSQSKYKFLCICSLPFPQNAVQSLTPIADTEAVSYQSSLLPRAVRRGTFLSNSCTGLLPLC